MEEHPHTDDGAPVTDKPKAPALAVNPYARARHTIDQALEQTRQRLAGLRANRDAINREIKHLVAEEDLLTRMDRIAKQAKEVRDGDEAPATEPALLD